MESNAIDCVVCCAFSYLDFALRQVKVSENVDVSVKRLCELSRRCLQSLPHHTDLAFHTEMVDRLLACLPVSQHTAVYEDFLSLMPKSVDLLIR